MITKLTKSQRYSMLSCTEYIVDGEDMHRRNWKLQLKSNIGRLSSDNLSLKLLQLQPPSASSMLLTRSGDSPNDLLGVCTRCLWALSCRYRIVFSIKSPTILNLRMNNKAVVIHLQWHSPKREPGYSLVAWEQVLLSADHEFESHGGLNIGFFMESSSIKKKSSGASGWDGLIFFFWHSPESRRTISLSVVPFIKFGLK
jgi:hypothetical protein